MAEAIAAEEHLARCVQDCLALHCIPNAQWLGERLVALSASEVRAPACLVLRAPEALCAHGAPWRPDFPLVAPHPPHPPPSHAAQRHAAGHLLLPSQPGQPRARRPRCHRSAPHHGGCMSRVRSVQSDRACTPNRTPTA